MQLMGCKPLSLEGIQFRGHFRDLERFAQAKIAVSARNDKLTNTSKDNSSRMQ